MEQEDIVEMGYNQIKFTESNKQSMKEDILQNFPSKDIVQSNVRILLLGETGTGKSNMAAEIHRKSCRAGNFVQINPASFSEGLVESELFGHIKGAFTGAFHHKQGAISQAHRGTLFIDEIDSLPLSIQIKLLIFLDTKKIRPVGGHQDKKIDVRLIFASGKNLSDMVNKKKMRSDFYYRVTSGFKIQLRPLRSDKEKIKMICEDYLQKTESKMIKGLMDFYMDYQWPGNIRQLIGHLHKKKTVYNGRKWRFDQMDEQLEGETLLLECKSHRFLTIQEVKIQYACKVYYILDKKLKETAKVLNISSNTFEFFS